MRIRVRLFAALAEAAGTREIALDLPAGSAAEAVARLAEAHPVIGRYGDRLLLAVNAVYADPTTALAEGDELALIPPVSGGASCF